MRKFLSNVWRLGIRELYSTRYDAFLVFLIVYTFTYAVYMPAKNAPSGVKAASIAIVDEDHSALSRRIAAGFLAPCFAKPELIEITAINRGLDSSHYTFVVDLPPSLEADVLKGRSPTIEVQADATALQLLMDLMPTPHFVDLDQEILYRGAASVSYGRNSPR
jgi:ABC-2 type transport system permease protein